MHLLKADSFDSRRLPKSKKKGRAELCCRYVSSFLIERRMGWDLQGPSHRFFTALALHCHQIEGQLLFLWIFSSSSLQDPGT